MVENESDSTFCSTCGAALSPRSSLAAPAVFTKAKWNCPACNAENETDSLFCEQCGYSVQKSDNKAPGTPREGRKPDSFKEIKAPVISTHMEHLKIEQQSPSGRPKEKAGSGSKSPSSPSPVTPLSRKQPPPKAHEKITPATAKTDNNKKMLQYGVIVIIVLAIILAIQSSKRKPEIHTYHTTDNGSNQLQITPSPDVDQNGTKKEELIKIVYDNFNSVNNKDFARVYNLRTERIRMKNSPEYYKEVYQENAAIEINEAHVQEVGPTQAKVAVNLTSYDIFNNIKIKSTHTGWFLLMKEQNRWLIDDSDLQLIDQSRVNP